jgi:CRP/FNR family transcriptional regulator
LPHKTTHQAVEAISAIPSFNGLEPSILEEIASAAVQRDFETKQVVFLEGEPCDGLYIIQSGWLKSIKISSSGREQVVRFVGPGEEFSGVGVFAGTRNQATVVALERSRLWIVGRDPLLRLMDKHPELNRIVIQNLAMRIHHLMDLVADLSLLSVEARLAQYILDHSRDKVMKRRIWSTQAEIAARLGTVPDVLSRALRALAEEGLIAIERQQIDILDRPGLEKKAGLSG